MNKLFIAVFTDGTQHFGGNLKVNLWMAIPQDKHIRSLFYSLPTGDMIALSGYDAYYQYIEVTNDIYGGRKGTIYRYSYVLAKKGNDVIRYQIDLQNSNVFIQKFDINDEYIKKLNPIIWKKGL